MARFSFVFFALFMLFTAQAKGDSLRRENPINEEAYLHPIDCITPYTLKKGEWIYAQSIQTLPFPSWAFVGITDKLTAQIDLLPWLFGPFTTLKKPIPSFNFRYRFNEVTLGKPTFAVEAMFVHFWDTLQRFETPTMTVWENGSYFHLKPVVGFQTKKNLYFNISLGIDYMKELILQNNDAINFQKKTFTNKWTPNFSFGLDWRPSKWISYHAGVSYGSTLTYLENVPRKIQVNYGFRVAPFYKAKWGLFRCLRIEFVAINGFFPDIGAKQIFPIPVFPYLYWQWKK